MLDKCILKIEEFILGGSIIVIALMICMNVISRQFFGPSIGFHSEVAKFAVVISTFMGISYAARKGRHISMSAIYDTVPWRIRKAMAILIPLVTALILFALTYVSFEYVVNEYERGTTTAYLGMPTYIMYLFIPLGFFMGGIQFVRNLIVNIVNKEVYIGTDALDYNDIKPEDRHIDDQMQV
nr:TRAP transporter small permease [Gracilibacillus suaedae]